MGGGGAKVVVLLTSGLAGAAAASMVLMPARAKRDLGLGAGGRGRETDRWAIRQAGRGGWEVVSTSCTFGWCLTLVP